MLFLTSLIAGLLFGVGLIISGMTNPDKIIGFLDIFGNWNPSLLFVMLGAVFISFFAFRHASKKSVSFLDQTISMPTKKDIDFTLIYGSIIFGIGWGLAGYCPGPAIATIATINSQAVVFVIAMLFGILIYEVIKRSQENLNK